MTIRRRLFVLALSLLIPALIACLLSGYVVYRVERARGTQNLLNTAMALASGVDAELRRRVSVLEALAASSALARDDLAAFGQEARRAVDGPALWVVLTAADGRQLVNTAAPPGTILPTDAGREDIRRAMESGRPAISNLFIGRVSGRLVTAVDIPVRRDGWIVYVLSMIGGPESLVRILDQPGIPRRWEAAILDADRKVVARSHEMERYVGATPPAPLAARMAEAEAGLVKTHALSGGPVLAAFSRSPSYGWYFAVGVPQSELIAPIRELLQVVGLAALILAGLGAPISLLVGRRITRPIGALAGPVMALGRGEVPDYTPSGLAEVDRVAEALVSAGRQRDDMAARFREAVGSAPVPIMLHAEDGRVLALSRTWTETSGYSLADIPTIERWTDLAYGPRGAAVRAQIAGIYAAPAPIDVGEHQVRTADGGERFWVFRAAPVGRDRTGLRLAVSIAADLTERVRAEQAMVAAKVEAEMANLAKSKFLAAASHDLRQPLQALVLLNEALRVRLAGGGLGKLVETMGASLSAMQMLMDGLLDVSRLDAGVIVPELRPVAVGALVRRLADEYSVRAAEKALKLRAASCAGWGETDPALLERVLRNLLENAIRYTDRGGIVIGCRQRGDGLEVHVRDTGIGIAPEQQDAVFQEFYQVGNPERDRNKGLGLGLSIVRRLTQLLGHDLRLDSTPGRGTRFVIALRQCAAPAQAAEEAAGPERGPCHGRVMVIDDEALVRDSLGTILEQWGYRVQLAADSAEALGLLSAEGCPDAVIADYRLAAGQTGIAAVRQLNGACGHAIPAVIITGDTDPERIAEASGSGFHIAHKPVSTERLKEMVEGALAAA